jgi:hypothetical protein
MTLNEPQEGPPEQGSESDLEEYQKHCYSKGCAEWSVWFRSFDEAEYERLREISWCFEVAMRNAQKGRRFCISNTGYLCTAPLELFDMMFWWFWRDLACRLF